LQLRAVNGKVKRGPKPIDKKAASRN